MTIQIINPPIFKIVLIKLDLLIPQFHFTIKLLRIGGLGKIDAYKYCIRTRLEPVFDVFRVCMYYIPPKENIIFNQLFYII